MIIMVRLFPDFDIPVMHRIVLMMMILVHCLDSEIFFHCVDIIELEDYCRLCKKKREIKQ